MRAHRATVSTLAAIMMTAAGLVACGDDDQFTAPEVRTLGSDGPGASAPVDTMKPPPTIPFRVSGRILGVRVTHGSADTLAFEPIVGARIRIHRNILVDGEARQVLAAETTSGANGAYDVKSLAGGYYIVSVEAPPGSRYRDGWTYLSGISPEVKLDVHLWPKP
jgi:hypothetical protein